MKTWNFRIFIRRLFRWQTNWKSLVEPPRSSCKSKRLQFSLTILFLSNSLYSTLFFFHQPKIEAERETIFRYFVVVISFIKIDKFSSFVRLDLFTLVIRDKKEETKLKLEKLLKGQQRKRQKSPFSAEIWKNQFLLLCMCVSQGSNISSSWC